MSPEELLALVVDARADGRTEMVLKLCRRATGKRVRVLPGVMGEVVQWGDGIWAFPTVCFVQVADIEKALTKAAKAAEAAR